MTIPTKAILEIIIMILKLIAEGLPKEKAITKASAAFGFSETDIAKAVRGKL